MADNLVAWIDNQIASLQRQHDHPYAGRDARAQHSNDIERFTQLRAAADLLARVRAECCYTLTETPVIDGWAEFESQLLLTGPPDLMRELAEALTPRKHPTE